MVCSCSDETKFEIEVNYNPIADIKLTDTFSYDNSKSASYIGITRDLELIKDRIYISDRSSCKIHVFDLKLNYIKSSRGYGHGPGEFISPPYLSKDSVNLIVYCPGEELKVLDSNFAVIKKIRSPENFMTNFANPLIIHRNKVIATGFNSPPGNGKGICKITTAMIFNQTGNLIRSFCNFDKSYEENKDNCFYADMTNAFVSEGFDNSYFVLQLATYKYMQYDIHGNYLKTLYYKPKYFRDPPDISLSKARAMGSDEYYDKIATVTSYYKFLGMDKMNNVLVINYCTPKKEKKQTRSFTDTHNYLAILTSSGTCIYDGIIRGFVFAVEDGYIYTLIKEGDRFFTIGKYKICIKRSA